MARAADTNSIYDFAGGAPGTTNTTPDGLNRDAAIAAVGAPCGASNAGYDCNGNLTFDGVRRFAYDGENRLLSETGPTTLSLAYDPLGRLQQYTANGTVTQFLYDDSALVAEYNGSSLLRRYVHGPGVDSPLIWFEGAGVAAGNANYLVADRQGSIIAAANGAGAASAPYNYDPYSVPTAWGGSRFRYTGQIEIPEAKLYYYKARVYDPAMGRFLQTDPIGYGSDLNLYAYVTNDPTDLTDPTGAKQVCSTSRGPSQGGVSLDGKEILVELGPRITVCNDIPDPEPATQRIDPPARPQQAQSGQCHGAPAAPGTGSTQSELTAQARNNAAQAASHYWNPLNIFWFRSQVQNKGPWDYKQFNRGYQDFGNYNYGRTGAAMGLATDFMLGQAGRAQQAAGTSKPEWGSPGVLG